MCSNELRKTIHKKKNKYFKNCIMKTNKGVKTSITAFVVLILGVATVTALIFDKIDGEKFTMIMSSIGVLGTMVIGYFSKDENQSHTKD